MDARIADSLEADLEFMRCKLEESRRALENADIVIPYDNGGGQMGIRRNPAFDAYEALLKSFVAALKEYREHAKMQPSREPQLVKFDNFAKTMRKSVDV
ncbi:MAG: hypothetical protein IJ113_01010 [Eggerthellaceae bacterium]|nr:hypothetical protein [Eggerthellaceae bacterium]